MKLLTLVEMATVVTEDTPSSASHVFCQNMTLLDPTLLEVHPLGLSILLFWWNLKWEKP